MSLIQEKATFSKLERVSDDIEPTDVVQDDGPTLTAANGLPSYQPTQPEKPASATAVDKPAGSPANK